MPGSSHVSRSRATSDGARSYRFPIAWGTAASGTMTPARHGEKCSCCLWGLHGTSVHHERSEEIRRNDECARESGGPKYFTNGRLRILSERDTSDPEYRVRSTRSATLTARDRSIGTRRQDRSQPWRSRAMLRPVPRRHGGRGRPGLPFDVPVCRLHLDDRSIIEATTRIFERSSDRSVGKRHDRKGRHERAPRKRRRRRHEKAGSWLWLHSRNQTAERRSFRKPSRIG